MVASRPFFPSPPFFITIASEFNNLAGCHRFSRHFDNRVSFLVVGCRWNETLNMFSLLIVLFRCFFRRKTLLFFSPSPSLLVAERCFHGYVGRLENINTETLGPAKQTSRWQRKAWGKKKGEWVQAPLTGTLYTSIRVLKIYISWLILSS